MTIEDDKMEICDGCDEFMFECSCDEMKSSSEQFDFILVRQKDYILDLINKRKYKEAHSCLTCLCELWTTHNYKYKYDELIERLKKQQ